VAGKPDVRNWLSPEQTGIASIASQVSLLSHAVMGFH
jgi:hypothetical protein